MADKKISELTELTTPDGTEELVVNDSGVSKKIQIDNLIADNGLSGDKIDGGTISNFTSTGIDDNATSTAITIDSSENVGIGVTPEAWHNGYHMIQLAEGSAVGGYVDNSTYLSSNWKDDAANKYINTDEASVFKQSAGKFMFMSAPSGSADAACTLTTKMLIDNSGNVGIGVTPESWYANMTALQIGNSTSIRNYSVDGRTYYGNNVYDDAAYKYLIDGYATQYVQSQNGAHVFQIAPSGTADSAISWTTAMTIKNDGGIEIGAFDTNGATKGLSYSGTGTDTEIRTSTTSTVNEFHYRFHNPNGEVGGINTNGSATSYNTSSDYRLKENVVPMTGSIDRLKELKPSRFNFKADADKTVDGFLAHEAGEVVPECATGTKDAMRTEEYEVTPAVMDGETEVTPAVMGEREVEDYQGIDQSKLVPLLVSALQEAIERIEQLENAQG